MIIPNNYKQLQIEETIRKGDFFWDNSSSTWSSLEQWIGNKVSKSWKDTVCITKKSNIDLKEIDYTSSQKNEILKSLKTLRAFNKDSAIKIKGKDLSLYFSLWKDKNINCINNDRFYLK